MELTLSQRWTSRTAGNHYWGRYFALNRVTPLPRKARTSDSPCLKYHLPANGSMSQIYWDSQALGSASWHAETRPNQPPHRRHSREICVAPPSTRRAWVQMAEASSLPGGVEQQYTTDLSASTSLLSTAGLNPCVSKSIFWLSLGQPLPTSRWVSPKCDSAPSPGICSWSPGPPNRPRESFSRSVSHWVL